MMNNMLFNIFPIFFFAVFAVVFVVIISTAVKAVKEKRANDASPVLEVEATVSAKRTHVSGVSNWGTDGDLSSGGLRSYTTYYVTFQVRSGDRMELQVSDRDYGQLVEGDFGKLTFQGTRYLEFKRERVESKKS